MNVMRKIIPVFHNGQIQILLGNGLKHAFFHVVGKRIGAVRPLVAVIRISGAAGHMDDPDAVVAAPDQTSGTVVRNIVQRLDGLHHPPPCFLLYQRTAVEN